MYPIFCCFIRIKSSLGILKFKWSQVSPSIAIVLNARISTEICLEKCQYIWKEPNISLHETEPPWTVGLWKFSPRCDGVVFFLYPKHMPVLEERFGHMRQLMCSQSAGPGSAQSFLQGKPTPCGRAEHQHSFLRTETSCSGGSGWRQPAHLWPLSHRQERMHYLFLWPREIIVNI